MTQRRRFHAPAPTYRLAALLVTGALAVVPGQVAPAAATTPTTPTTPTTAAGAPAGTRTLASGPSGFPARIDVIGADAGHVVFANEAQAAPTDGGYVQSWGAAPAAGGRTTYLGLDGGQLSGASVAGSTLVFTDFSAQPRWIDVESGRSGLGRNNHGSLDLSWETAVPGGGAWVGDGAPRTLLTTTTARPDATPTRLATLPDIAVRGDARAAAADANGIAAVSGATVDYYSFATRTVRKLDTGGAAAAGFTCTSATATAIGCFNATEVLRVPTSGAAPTIIRTSGARRVVVGPTGTAWIAYRPDPVTSAATGPLYTAVAGSITHTAYVVTGVAAVGNDFTFSRFGPGLSGVYRTAAAGSPARLLSPAPALPRQTFDVALTAGRVSWIDDSSLTYPVRSRRLLPRGSGPAFRLGPTVVTAPSSAGFPWPAVIDSPISRLAISDSRSLFVTGSHLQGHRLVGTVVLAGSSGQQILSRSGDGAVALSGSVALWETGAGHVLVRDLSIGRTRDITAIVGPGALGVNGDLTNALYGRYLAYAKGGWAWRLDLVTGRSVRIGRDAAGQNFGGIMTAGDWVIWESQSSPRSPLRYRNARTMGPVRTVRGVRELMSVYQAGFVSLTGPGRQVFRTWGATADHPLPAVDNAVTAAGHLLSTDGGRVAWVAPDGYPKVAPYAASAARPQALGAAFAPASIRAATGWTLAQPTSQMLGSCTVVIRGPGGAVVAKLRCSTASAAQGEAVAVWNGRVGGKPAPAGNYAWRIVAGNRSGSILAGTGIPGAPVAGTVLVTG